MRTEDFGGFSTRTCSIDLRFSNIEQFNHFVQAWTTTGRPNLEAFPPERWLEMIAIGTTLEHELRHYHDFLLSYTSLHSYWIRMQAIMNASPIMHQMLNDSNNDYLVFPATEWARLDLSKRAAYLVDALGSPSAFQRTWNPPVLAGPKPQRKILEDIVPVSDDAVKYALFVLRDQLDVIKNVRGDSMSPQSSFLFPPRFTSELSSLLVQCASVRETYGIKEMDLFLNRLSNDRSLYARFFRSMLVLFSKTRPKNVMASATLLRTEDVDWFALSVGITWCFCGSNKNPLLLKPADRMARLIEATKENLVKVFPPRLGSAAELLDHLDTHFEVEGAHDAARHNSRTLRTFFQRTASRLTADREFGNLMQPLLDIFGNILDQRDRVVTQIFEDPDGYMDITAYAKALPSWPQCPVSFDFRPAGIVVSKKHLSSIGTNPIFSDTRDEAGQPIDGMVAEVYFPSFLPGGTTFPLQKAIDFAGSRDLFDMIFDPQQIDIERENQIRQSVSKNFGKLLLRYLP